MLSIDFFGTGTIIGLLSRRFPVGACMRTETLTNEAAKCRQQAKEFAGRPEQPFLLSVASAFEDLASKYTRLDSRGARPRA